MAVHNGARTITESVSSVLNQSLRRLELIIVDDASTDSTLQLLTSTFNDPRLTIVRQAQQCGLAASLNRGIDLALGPFIARLDADDVCLPDRLASQLSYMQQNVACGVLGGSMIALCQDGSTFPIPTSESDDVARELLRGNALRHPTVMIRSSVLHEHGIRYDASLENAQDYDLWCRLQQVTVLANTSRPLIYYRIHAGQESQTHSLRQRRIALGIQAKMLMRAAGSKSDFSWIDVAVGYLYLIKHSLGFCYRLLTSRRRSGCSTQPLAATAPENRGNPGKRTRY